jgi:hypothetical protein
MVLVRARAHPCHLARLVVVCLSCTPSPTLAAPAVAMSCAGKQTQTVAHAAVSAHAGVSGLAGPCNSATAPAQTRTALAALMIGNEGQACAGAAERQRKRPVEAAAGHAGHGKVGQCALSMLRSKHTDKHLVCASSLLHTKAHTHPVQAVCQWPACEGVTFKTA